MDDYEKDDPKTTEIMEASVEGSDESVRAEYRDGVPVVKYDVDLGV